MPRDAISVQYPVIENSDSVASMTVVKTNVVVANGIEVKKALSGKNNTLVLVINNTSVAAKTLTLKAGNRYPNSILGDLTIPLGIGETVVQFQDPSRFENKTGSIELDFLAAFTGTIYAIAKRTDLLPAI